MSAIQVLYIVELSSARNHSNLKSVKSILFQGLSMDYLSFAV